MIGFLIGLCLGIAVWVIAWEFHFKLKWDGVYEKIEYQEEEINKIYTLMNLHKENDPPPNTKGWVRLMVPETFLKRQTSRKHVWGIE